MIVSFRHKGLKRFFEAGDRSKLPAQMIHRIQLVLLALDTTEDLVSLDRPGFRLHQLKGGLNGIWSITINANWRITFAFTDGDVADVDFVDYH